MDDKEFEEIKKIFDSPLDKNEQEIIKPESDLSSYDQLLACEAIDEATPVNKEELYPNNSVFVRENVDDICKRKVNLELPSSKQQVIDELKTCTYKTPPYKIASLLKKLFIRFDTEPGWWLYVAQHWTPRAINRVISRMIKLHKNGEISILNAAAYFTFLIKFRKKRKVFTNINDIRKPQSL